MKKWMYVVIGVVVVVAVVLAVRLAPERPLVENDVNDVVNDVPDNGIPDNDVPDNDVPDIATATSLRYTVEWSNGETGTWTYMAKNMGTEDLKLRWEGTVDGDEGGFIINGELQKIWALEDDKWVEIPAEIWDMFWEQITAPFEAYTTELYGWTHGDWTYVDPTGVHVRISDIHVNPHLSDALFEP